MDMTLGAKEEVNKECFYCLRDGTRMSREEWTGLVKAHIEEHNHDKEYNKVLAKAMPWSDRDTKEEYALQIYASIYCTSLERKRKSIGFTVPMKMAKNEQGYNQLSFV